MISYHIINIIISVKLFSDGKNDKGIAAGWGKTNVFGGGSTLAMKFVSFHFNYLKRCLTILLKPNMNIIYFENRLEKPSSTCFKKNLLTERKIIKLSYFDVSFT